MHLQGASFKMTATATSISRLDRRNLISTLLDLPDEDFWSIIELRLNLPSSSCHLDRNDDIEYWTENALVEELFLQLACTKKTAVAQNRISKKYMTVTNYKYYKQAEALRKWIPIAMPPPEFIVNLSDLSTRVFGELK